MRLPRRTQASLAASADGQTSVLFNATTDVRAQIERDAALVPRARRDSPIVAIVLTDANIDHAAGLLDFRQAGPLAIYSTDLVRRTLCAQLMFEPFARPPRTWNSIDGEFRVAGLRVSPIRVPGLLPAYAGGMAAEGAATAFAIEDESGARG